MTLQEMAIDHPYYCATNNYFSNEAQAEYETWGAFYQEYEQADPEINLVFRWDVFANVDDNDKPLEGYYMLLFIMVQNKGLFIPVRILSIEEKDLPEINKYLGVHWKLLNKMWQPVSEQQIKLI